MIFITGGVRSGKSSFAEKLAMKKAEETNGCLHYIATGVASDEEMKKRIIRHQTVRENSKFQWKTWEQPRNIAELAHHFNKKGIVLLDCVTTLLNNELFFEERTLDESAFEEINTKLLVGIEVIKESGACLIIVSNELLFDTVRENELVLFYCRILGKIHQEIVKKARVAYLVEAGIPIMMKGGENCEES